MNIFKFIKNLFKKDHPDKYKLKLYISDRGIIILGHINKDKKSSIIGVTLNNSNDYFIGHYSINWASELFKEYNEEIILPLNLNHKIFIKDRRYLCLSDSETCFDLVDKRILQESNYDDNLNIFMYFRTKPIVKEHYSRLSSVSKIKLSNKI
jgi:hypothetical protein